MLKLSYFHKCILTLVFAGCILFAGCNFSDGDSENKSPATAGTPSTPSGTGTGTGTGTSGTSTSSGSATLTTTSTVEGEITTFNSSASIDVTSWSNSYTPNTSTRNIITDASKYEDVTFAGTLYINLSTMQVSLDNSTWTTLTDGGEKQTLTLDSTEISANINDGILTVNSSSYESNLKFDITGTAQTGALNISSYKKGTIALYLHDAAISSSGNYPAINVDAKSTVYLELEGENSLTDGRTYGTGYSEQEGTDYYTSTYTGTTDGLDLTQKWAKGNDTKGTLYTKGPLLIGGSGSLTLTEGFKHGIYSKDYIRVFGGTLTVNTSGRNAIQSVNGFVMDGGNITISGTGKNTNNESRGIIVEGSEDNAGEGFIVINGGTITSTTVSKGISAKWDIDDDAETTETTDDPYPYVLINGGKITITTTGTPQDESSSAYSFTDADGVTVSEKTKLSPEGIEGKQALYITGGILTLNCTDDCINTSRDTKGYAGQIIINGGNIYAYSSNNDAIDSNGNLTINGGIVTAFTKTTPESAFDCDENTFAITGGLIAGLGTTNYSKPTANACTQSTLVLSGSYMGSGNTTFAIEDTDGNAVFALKIPSEFSSSNNYLMILSSPNIKTDTSYKAVSGVTAANGTTFKNLYIELPTVSGGNTTVSGISSSTSSYVYTNASGTGGAMEGNHPNAGPGNRM